MDKDAANESFQEIQDDVEMGETAAADCNNNLDFMCDVCGRSFQTKSGIARHMAGHNKSKKYTCQLCQQQFPTRDTMKGT